MAVAKVVVVFHVEVDDIDNDAYTALRTVRDEGYFDDIEGTDYDARPFKINGADIVRTLTPREIAAGETPLD